MRIRTYMVSGIKVYTIGAYSGYVDAIAGRGRKNGYYTVFSKSSKNLTRYNKQFKRKDVAIKYVKRTLKALALGHLRS